MQTSTDITESVKHKRYIEILADETHHPVEEVEPIYDDVHAHLKEKAAIPDFVPVFAWRRTRALLMQR